MSEWDLQASCPTPDCRLIPGHPGQCPEPEDEVEQTDLLGALEASVDRARARQRGGA